MSASAVMSLFCLVHGSTQNPSGWALLVPVLQQQGHETVLADLPVDQPEASATVYAQAIATAIPKGRDDSIVVAHSASGLFLPLVPELRQVHRLVFLAAVIPQIGKSLMDQTKADLPMFNPEWIGKDPTKSEELARQFLFHDCSDDVARWAWSTMRLMFARGALIETCPLRDWPDIPCSYVVCADDRTLKPEWCRRTARARLGVDAIELPGGHCPHVSRPRELAALLAALD